MASADLFGYRGLGLARRSLLVLSLTFAAAALASCVEATRNSQPVPQLDAPGWDSSRPGCGDRPARSQTSIERFIDNVRTLELPDWLSNKIIYLDPVLRLVLHDPRSHLADPSRVDRDTVVAAELAYDVEDVVDPSLRSSGRLPTDTVARQLPAYRLAGTFADTFSGFKAAVFEQGEGTAEAHRIYAVAGTQVFENTDFRDWASGLMMGEPQFVSDATLRMIRDAADYARDMEHGGEVFVTGQSQGALGAQGIGFLLEEYLDALGSSHHLVHVVAWGAAGAEETIDSMIERFRGGEVRSLWPPLERHRSLAEPERAETDAVWHTITERWRDLADDEIDAHVRVVAARMRIVGFFFEIDPFARVGRFLGTSLVLPTEMMLPDRCEYLVLELLFRTRLGKLGVTLESHFLNGYRRAVMREAILLARPAEPEKWPWAMDRILDLRELAADWLVDQYLATLAESPGNWRLCLASREWMTDRNSRCRRAYWPGCGPDGEDPGHWCLIRKGADATAGR